MIDAKATATGSHHHPRHHHAEGDRYVTPRPVRDLGDTEARIGEITADQVHADMMRDGLTVIPHQVIHDTEGFVLLRCRVPNAQAGDVEHILAGYAEWLHAHGTDVTGPRANPRNPYYLTVAARVGGIRVEACGPLPHPGMARPPVITSENSARGGAA